MITKGRWDTSGWARGLEDLLGPVRKGLGRSMAVAGGKVLQSEAKARVRVDDGLLKESIYLAYRDKESSENIVVYSISWNATKAPHGHLIEFGHWRVNELVPIGAGGMWVALPDRLEQPKWVPAFPFLRPAYDAKRGAAIAAMIERARQRLPELLAGGAASGEIE